MGGKLEVARVQGAGAMSDEQIRQVQASYTSLGARLPDLAAAFYGYLLNLEPGLGVVCAGDVSAQYALVATLDELVGVLHHWALAARYARSLAQGLARRGINGRHYTVIGVALLAALREQLGPAWTLDLQVAWARTYARVAEVMHDTTARR